MIHRLLCKRRMRAHSWSQARFSDYLDGDLRSTESERVEEHVHRCPECPRLLESLRRTLRGLVDLRIAPDESIAPGVVDRLLREI